MNYLGDFPEDATVMVPFTTSSAAGAAVAPSSGFEAADVVIYKGSSATQKTSTNGLTMTSPFDSITGLHVLAIDTSNDTGDAAFWVAGADYTVVLSPDTETVDGQTIVAVLATFSIENRGSLRSKRAVNAITKGTVGSASSVTSIVTSSLDPAASVTDQFKGLIVAFDKDTTTANLRGQKTDITASTTGGVLTVTSLTTAPVSGDIFTIS
jgi:hypothetical protein